MVQRANRRLGVDIEFAKRLDFIIEQLDANRQQPIGRKNVDDAAAVREFTRKLHGTRRVETALDEPAQQLVDIDPFALVQHAGR